MGVWDTLRVYDRSIAADPKDRFVTNGRPGYGLAQTTPDYKDRFLSGGTPAPAVNLTTSTPTPYTDQFLRPQTPTPSAQVPSAVPAAARPTAAREVARRVATTPAQRPVPIAQPTISYGNSYPTEGEALMAELLAANAAPAAPVNPIYGPPAGVTVMDTNGVRQVSTEGFTGRPMDEGFVGRYAAANTPGQMVLADGGTPRVVYKNPNAIPEGLFKGVPGVQGDNLRLGEVLTASGQYDNPSARIADILATGTTLGKDYHTVQQGDYYGAEAAAAPIKAQASATGAAAQMVDANSNAMYRAGMLPIERIKADASMKQAVTKEGGNPNAVTLDERTTKRLMDQYDTNLKALNSDLMVMKQGLTSDQKMDIAMRKAREQIGITPPAPSAVGVPAGATPIKNPKTGARGYQLNGRTYTLDGKEIK